MRLWSIHPRYLDTKGLVALWREALLAQKVLQGETQGYKKHPQLQRFREQKQPLVAIGDYLYQVYLEGKNRGYNFRFDKICLRGEQTSISVNSGQVEVEFNHLLNKLKGRDPDKYKELLEIKEIKIHPLFTIRKGGIEEWERAKL